MSDILIRMEMPRNCFQCPLSVLKGERLFCEVTKEEVLRAKLAPECPLHELPPHGDLIDVSKPLELHCVFIKDQQSKFTITAPTVVPAERSEP